MNHEPTSHLDESSEEASKSSSSSKAFTYRVGDRVRIDFMGGAVYGTVFQVVNDTTVRVVYEHSPEFNSYHAVSWRVSDIRKLCRNCRRLYSEHAQNAKCLYAPGYFE
jgi:hypothetical protein